MDNQEPVIAFTGMDPLPSQDDDDEIVTAGEPIWDVVKVSAIAPLTLAVEFENGVKGKVRFDEKFLHNVWAKLRDPDYFSQVGIRHGTVSWPNEQPDLAPDTLYDEIAKHGEYVLN